jgi:ABC-type nitrate/sulfonate/bicarbonate transport system permease component
VALPGYALGLAAGAGLAVLCVLLPAAQALVMPAAVALRAVPILMTAPLIVLALGRGSAGAVTVVAVMIFFPTLVACLHGLRQAPAPLLDLFHSYGAGRWRRLAGVELPAMLPAFFASARMAVPAAVLAATTAEWLATGRGTGALMAVAAATSGHAMLWSCVVALAGGALLAHAAVGGAERAVLARFAPEQLGR